jgi:hypothetical protein
MKPQPAASLSVSTSEVACKKEGLGAMRVLLDSRGDHRSRLRRMKKRNLARSSCFNDGGKDAIWGLSTPSDRSGLETRQ